MFRTILGKHVIYNLILIINTPLSALDVLAVKVLQSAQGVFDRAGEHISKWKTAQIKKHSEIIIWRFTMSI